MRERSKSGGALSAAAKTVIIFRLGWFIINKIRVHELSKELGIQSKELMNFLNKLGANVRNHMSTIEDNFVEQARQAFPAPQKQSRFPQLKPATPEGVKPQQNAAVSKEPVTQPYSAKVAPGNAPKPRAATPVSGPNRPPVTNQAAANPETRRSMPGASGVNQAPVKPAPVNNQIPKQAPANQAPKQAAPAFQPGGKPSGPMAGKPQPQVNPHARTESRGPVRPGTTGNQGGFSGRPQAQAQAQGRVDSHPQNRPHPPERNDAPRDNRGAGANKFSGQHGVERHPSGQPSRNPRPNQNQPNRGGKPATTRPGHDFHAGNAHGQTGTGPNRGRWNNQQQHNKSFAPAKPVKPQGPATTVKSVQLPDVMSVKDFAHLIEIAAGDVIKKLIGLGVMATINQDIDRDTMTLIADEYGITASAAPTEEEKLRVEEIEDDPKSLVSRSPVVTIMGHVDHGKTSLLDAIRQTNVTEQEAGGITQHIGAYQVELKNHRKITFLDTPGHAAFTAMRARGAQVTDIVVLVVAADDGVMPQTIEAINHAKDANVPIIVAVNKIDKPGANPDRVKQDLTEYNLVAEEWGGDTIFVPVSAKQRTGIESLLEMILLVADVKDLKANPDRTARGTIIEAQLDKSRGPVATVLVQNGTLEIGDSIIAGAAAGKVRVLINDKGKRVKKAGPATPVEVIGFTEVPGTGDIMDVVTEDHFARELAGKRMQLKREHDLKKTQKITLDDLFSKIKEGEIKEVKVIIKADVQGSVEAIRQSLEQLSTDKVRVKVIHGGVGGIGEDDVMFASASNAIIIGFNVRPDPIAKRSAEKENVDIRLYRIIYNIIEDVQKAMEGMLAPEFQEAVCGRAEVRAVYKVPKVGNIAGCYVVEGKISRNNDIRLIRDNIVIHEGKIESLKRFKDDAREVTEGFECGVGIEKFNDIKEGDIIEAFTMEEVKRTATK